MVTIVHAQREAGFVALAPWLKIDLRRYLVFKILLPTRDKNWRSFCVVERECRSF